MRFGRLLAVLLLVLVPVACSGDDDDGDGGGSASASASAAADGEDDADDDGDDEGDEDEEPTTDPVTGMTQSDPLDPDEAREAGNPDVYARIDATTDCSALADELESHEENADTRRDGGDERRASILDAYAEATRERMAELDCPETGGGTSTTSPGV